MRIINLLVSLVLLFVGLLCSCSNSQSPNSGNIHLIKHVIIIFQENRSFDSYFGTYPGALGIPMKDNTPSVCVPDPASGQCVKPYPDHSDSNGGGPHDATNSTADVDGGKMDGFINQAERGRRGCLNPTVPLCTNSQKTDVMGYHTQSDIPNYWSYAKNFVLQDHMFESVHSWSFPSHLYLISGFAANCSNSQNPMSCSSSLDPVNRSNTNPTPFGWTDLTYLLAKYHVSWGWYLDHGAMPDNTPVTKISGKKSKVDQLFANKSGVPKIWNVLPGFTDLYKDGQLNQIQDLSNFFQQAKEGNLPSVSWILPDGSDSEHPPALVSVGQSYVTNIINAVMKSPEWSSSAIFVTWDDWGGFYDQVIPPDADALGYGIRVPGLVISPYAKKSFIDHQTLSFDAYLKFIEDDFCNSQRLNPRTDGRPDSRPIVREDVSILGNLANDFDFNQKPRAPLILSDSPKTTLTCPNGSAPGSMGTCNGTNLGGAS